MIRAKLKTFYYQSGPAFRTFCSLDFKNTIMIESFQILSIGGAYYIVVGLLAAPSIMMWAKVGTTF
jgi:hypothetical protein